ncbi:hydrolase [Mycolicibacterium mageritense DSM 44476 = CIP 104973]|uniref:Haloacid dehalogenase-like hydrolase n=1 Tax=Mycolicibacterium mageritense TaxID=53462 RepID=A0AAI8TPU1_MYCME|nr:phosphonatase-like hydrolase [Mycolicibacterium mageritense]TXI64986.1 MAG: phosphonatase-like hydrolase [Mycolicibacterium mageritense]BBX32633.1 putative haloacid dehalogenase-like hydrolase [Mycolicibacterium mageritense]BDY28698.1 Phosphonoacetaldehyde hydrolase [Mycolicibacterium mageritense]CDO22826.1 hydrolase [Mycolicibacterium mageritense DSM 44476 = CIP 104973]
MRKPKIQLAVIDMAGTTVADDGLVVSAFDAAATAAGLPEDGPDREQARQYVLDTMGQSKIVVFRALFGTEELAQRANTEFERAYADLIANGQAAPIDGAADSITELRDAGIRVALTTGFSGATQDKLLAALGWHGLADLVLAPGDGVRGRPYPDLILAALIRLQADGVANVAALGDTTSDVESARRAGVAIAAGTLTGAHDEEQLRGAGATHVVGSITDFADLLLHG